MFVIWIINPIWIFKRNTNEKKKIVTWESGIYKTESEKISKENTKLDSAKKKIKRFHWVCVCLFLCKLRCETLLHK